MGASKLTVSLSQVYSRILTETFVYPVSWHGQLMSDYTVCPPLLVGQTMTIKYRHQLTMPSNKVNKISCLRFCYNYVLNINIRCSTAI